MGYKKSRLFILISGGGATMPPTPQNDRLTDSECTGMREEVEEEVLRSFIWENMATVKG